MLKFVGLGCYRAGTNGERNAERTNNGSGKRLSLYLDVNWKIRWAYSSRNYVNNFTSVMINLRCFVCEVRQK